MMRIESIYHATGLFRDALAGTPGLRSANPAAKARSVLAQFLPGDESAAEEAAFTLACEARKVLAEPGRRERSAEDEAARRVICETGSLAWYLSQALAARDDGQSCANALERFGETWVRFQARLSAYFEALDAMQVDSGAAV